jgi:hypothetical protein
MKNYTVHVYEVHVIPVEVEAASPEEARQKANDAISDGLDYSDMQYDHTVDKQYWPVIDENGRFIKGEVLMT